MKLSVLYNIFSEQGLRVPMAIFNRFTFLVTSQPQEQRKRFLLVSPTHEYPSFPLSTSHL